VFKPISLSSHMTNDRVLRDATYYKVSVKAVVPGDVVSLQEGIVYCDMVILQGSLVLLDESALTGESTPVVKVALDAAA
jgi:P-type Ca2+ transporter type 2C